MCGHGTVALMTRMIEQGIVRWDGATSIEVELVLPTITATVEMHRRHDNRPLVMVDIKPAAFRQASLDMERLADLLGLRMTDYEQEYPVEIAAGDLSHLIVPVRGLAANPEYAGCVPPLDPVA